MRWTQALLLSLLFVFPSLLRANEAALRQQLATDCDALLAVAIRRPYGWAWPVDAEQRLPLPRDAQPVGFLPGETPSAALVLAWAGELLNQPRYQEAAQRGARGILAAQQSTGRVQSRAAFGNAVRNLELPGPAIDRPATTASLALLLTLLEASPDDQRLRSGAVRSAHWLLQQQTPKGTWPTPLRLDRPDGPPTLRQVVRLDSADYRDSTLALFLAARALPDPRFPRNALKAAQQLPPLRCAASDDLTGGLWQAIYELTGRPLSHPAHPPAIDLLASQTAVETLLAASLLADTEIPALPEARSALAFLRLGDGTWLRKYPLKNNVLQPGEVGAPAVFAPARDDNAPADIDPAQLDASLQLIQELTLRGRPAVRSRLDLYGKEKRAIARVLTGLADGVLVRDDLPHDPASAKTWLETHPWAAESQRLSGNDLPQRLRRIDSILIRIQIVRLALSAPAGSP